MCKLKWILEQLSFCLVLSAIIVWIKVYASFNLFVVGLLIGIGLLGFLMIANRKFYVIARKCWILESKAEKIIISVITCAVVIGCIIYWKELHLWQLLISLALVLHAINYAIPVPKKNV